MEKSMSTEFKLIEEPKKQLSMNPKKFAMWLFIATVLMLFAAFTSAYIVRRAEGNWVFFELPGNNKFAMPIKALHDHEYEDFEEACKTVKMPFISRVLYSRLKSYAELTLMMRGY